MYDGNHPYETDIGEQNSRERFILKRITSFFRFRCGSRSRQNKCVLKSTLYVYRITTEPKCPDWVRIKIATAKQNSTMATACESKGVKRPRLERLNERLEDPPFDVTLKAMMAGVRRRSVGKRAIELMSETLTETSGTLACLMSESDEESAFPIARTHLTWSNFADDWYVDVLRTRVAFISIGRRGQTGVGNLFISSLSLDPISVPLSLLMSQNNPDNQNVGEWIRCRIPALHQIIRNKLIFKVVTPAGE